MTVATFLQTNFNTQTPSQYRTAIDGDIAVAAAIVDNFAPHAVATPNMTVQLDPGAIPGVGVLPTQLSQQTSSTLSAPTTNPRKDIVYIDAITGVIGVATGTEAVSPVDPAIPSGKIPVARLAMTVGMTSIANSIITDLRAPAMATSGAGSVTAITTNTTISVGQSGTTFKLSGTSVTATLPTPIGNSGIKYKLFGSDTNTQTVSTPAATLNFPDGTTVAGVGLANNQAIDIQSDGAVWRVLSMSGWVVAQTPATNDNTTKVSTTAMVQAAIAAQVPPINTITQSVQNSNYTLLTSDAGKILVCTTGSPTYTFLSAATFGATKTIYVKNSGSGIVTLQSAASSGDNIGGCAPNGSVKILSGEVYGFLCDGTNTYSVFLEFSPKFQEFLANGTFYFPPGKTSVYAIAIAGGGAGGGGNSGGGGGGSSGSSVHRKKLTGTPGTSVSVVIGSGGTCASASSDGGSGGTTSFGSISLSGGGGGSVAGGAGATSYPHSLSDTAATDGSSGSNGGNGASTDLGQGGIGDSGSVATTPAANTGAGGGGGTNINSNKAGSSGGSGYARAEW